MVVLNTFWTPCFFYNDIFRAIKPIAFYSVMGSIVSITYTIYVMSGGESSNPYMPYFETDRSLSLFVYGGFAIVFFLAWSGASFLMLQAVKVEIRGWMLPWMIGMFSIIVVQLYFGFHWLFDYYIYLDQIFAMLCLWLWMAYHIYILMAVYSVYQTLMEKQSPAMLDLPPTAYTENTLFYWDETV